MRAGRYASACPKLEESYRLDPASGTLLNRAVCEERLGRKATAWAQYVRFVETVPGEDDRVRFVRQRIEALEPHLPRLRIMSPGFGGNALLSLDGVALSPASIGVDMPVDAGEHDAEIVWPDGARIHRTVTVAPDQTIAIELVASPADEQTPKTDPVETSAPVVDDPPLTLAPPARQPAESQHPAMPPERRTLLRAGYTAAGIGVLGFAGSVVLSILGASKKSTVSSHCQDRRCDDIGLRAASEGRALLRGADVGLVVGALGISTGGVLLFEGWSTKPVVDARTDGALLGIKGSW